MRKDGKRAVEATEITPQRFNKRCDFVASAWAVSTINTVQIQIQIQMHIKSTVIPSGNGLVSMWLCLLSQVLRIHQMEKLSCTFVHSLAHIHTHTQSQKAMCCLYHHCPYLYECRLDVCANSSQIRKLGNCRARNAFLSVLRQPSLCKHFKPCTVFSAISKIAFDFLFGLILFLNFAIKFQIQNKVDSLIVLWFILGQCE